MALLYKTVAYTTTGTKASLQLDPSIAPFNATVAVNIGGGATYKVQYTLDPLEGPTATDSGAFWYDSTNMPSGSTSSIVSSFVSPVARIRIVITAVTDTITLQVQQGMSIN